MKDTPPNENNSIYPAGEVDEEVAGRTLWAVCRLAKTIYGSVVYYLRPRVCVGCHRVSWEVPDKHCGVVEDHKEEGEDPVRKVEAADSTAVLLPLTSQEIIL